MLDFKKKIELNPKTSFFHKKTKKTKDFSWEGVDRNPFRKENKKGKRIFYFYLLLIFFSFLSTFFLVIFHPFFRINNLEIKGLQRIKENEIKSVTLDLLNLKSFIFLPNYSYFKVNIQDISEILKERFPIESINIKKVFPDQLQIEIEEKITTIIYDNSKEYSFINLEGDVIEIFRKVASYEWEEKKEISTSTNEIGEIVKTENIIDRKHEPDVKNLINDIGNYPIIYDKRNQEIEINKNVLSQEQSEKIVTWFGLLKNTNIKLKYFLIDDYSTGQLNIQTLDGWYIKTNIEREVEPQIRELETLLKQEIKGSFLNYIDLRYSDRIYWK